MIYNVAGLLTGPEGSVRQVEVEGEQIFTDRHRFTGVSGKLEMLRTDRTVLVTGVITADAEDVCGRCLEPALMTVATEFEEEFQPINRDLVGHRPAPVEADFDPALIIDERNLLDLSDSLAQALTASTPIAPLCRPECEGICPSCFADKNKTSCRCDQNPTDPRWQALASLTHGTSN